MAGNSSNKLPPLNLRAETDAVGGGDGDALSTLESARERRRRRRRQDSAQHSNADSNSNEVATDRSRTGADNRAFDAGDDHLQEAAPTPVPSNSVRDLRYSFIFIMFLFQLLHRLTSAVVG